MDLPTFERPRTGRSTRLENMRRNIGQLFNGSSSVGSRPSIPESPKTPPMALDLRISPSTRLSIPHLSPIVSNDASSHDTPSPTQPQEYSSYQSSISMRPVTPNAFREMQTIRPEPTRQSQSSRFHGVDSGEDRLIALASRRRRKRANKTKSKRMCFGHRVAFLPNIKNKRVRRKTIQSLLTGLLLLVVLSIYLGLALSDLEERQEFHVLLILIILVATIFFCHSLITLCMCIVRPTNDDDLPQMSAVVGPGGYANPARPIQVALARDEEAAGIESDATKVPPPAYGLWRESVRVDPDRIFWQRREEATHHRQISTPIEEPNATVAGAPRPPSYISEDGVEYVMEAAPRSIAPTTDVPLPQHPSERGRVAWPSR